MGLFGETSTVQKPAGVTAMPTAFSAPSSKDSLAQVGLRTGGRRLQAAKSATGGVLTILLQGEKDSSKTASLAGLAARRPPGTRFVIASFDDTTRLSLENYYGAEWVEKNVEVYEMTRRQVLPDGSIYRGYDPNDPSTAEAVLGEFYLLLDELEKDGKVWGFVVDHFQSFYEQVCKSYAAHVAGYSSTAQLEIKDWGVRTDTATKVETKTRRIVTIDGGIVAITGYAPEEKIVVKKVPDGKGGTKTQVTREVTAPKWLKDDLKRNWLVLLHSRVVRSGNETTNTTTSLAKDTYTIEVLTSKVRRFPKGAVVDITGSSLAKFWDPETVGALQDLADKMEATA